MKTLMLQNAIDTFPFGYIYCKVILNSDGKQVDYRFLEVNPAFEKITGLKKKLIIKKTLDEIIAETDSFELDWSIFYDMIPLRSGNRIIEQYSSLQKKWYQIQINSYDDNTFTSLFIDITDRKMIEDSLQKRESYLTSIFKNQPGMIWLKDAQGKYLAVNETFAYILNLETPSQAIGKTDFDIWPYELAERYHTDDLAIVRTGKPLSVEEKIFLSGESSWFEIFKTPVYGDQGSIIGITGYARNITSRKQIEEKLKSSEKNFRTFFETIEDLIFIGNQEGEIYYSNPAVTKKLGFTVDELSHMSLLDVHPKKKFKEAEQIFSDMFAGKRNTCPLPLVRKDGSYLPVETRIWFGQWDGKDCVFGVSKDLSAQEEALQKFNRLFQSNPALMALTSAEAGRYTEVNAAFLNTLGYTYDEIIGKTPSELDLIVEHQKLKEYTKKLIECGSIRNLELQVKTKSGKVLDGLFSGEVIETQGKKFLLTVMTDITERNMKEVELRQAKEAAEIASREKSVFLANMSHEIRTPLNSVIGFTNLLMQTSLDLTQKLYAGNANVAGKALLGIISNILDFSKIEAGKLELEIISTDIYDLMKQTIDIIKFQANQKGIELLIDIQPDTPRMIDTDPVRLKQVCINLLNNAIKFTEKGEVEFKLRYICSRQDKGRFEFSVRDTGIGITEQQQGKIFNSFSQADNSTTRKFGGTGLGLIISKMLIQKMGGEIGVSSIFGQGTTFSFGFETTHEEKDENKKLEILPINRVLMIDDCENSRIILGKNFNYLGIEFQGCDSGESALKLFETSSFDLLIIDYHMPGKDGLEVLEMIRKKVNIPSEKIPVMMLHSSSDDQATIDRFRRNGVKFNLAKPVISSELVQFLKEVKGVTSSREIEKIDIDKNIVTTKKDVTILIAEDVNVNMILINILVSRLIPGVKIIEARNGFEALEVAKKEKIDLILMDLQMPELDGIESTKMIREFEKNTEKRIPIIALTADALQEEKENALSSGMDDFLTKPLELEKLHEVFLKYLKFD